MIPMVQFCYCIHSPDDARYATQVDHVEKIGNKAFKVEDNRDPFYQPFILTGLGTFRRGTVGSVVLMIHAYGRRVR